MTFALSSAEQRFFADTGYVRIPHMLPGEHVRAMKDIITDHLQRKVPPCRVNSNGEVCRIDQVLARDPIFLDTIRLPQLMNPLQSLLGPNIEVLLYRHNHATRNARGDIPFRLHRDILQWSRSIVTAFIYLEDANTDNGCTHIVPSTHTLPFAGMPPDGGGGNWVDDHDEYLFALNQAVAVPMKRGQVLLINSLLFHSVGPNITDHSRMSTTFAFHSVDDMSGITDDPKRVLLSGERIYMGSDSKKVSGLLTRKEYTEVFP
jgi:ectoine hydroxylase-related dioxygenase (phytanoyl-CoA dioxygenase family)